MQREFLLTILHATKPRPFKPTGKGGGSKKGKPQGYWPMVIKVVADAILLRPKGTMDAWVIDRKLPMPFEEFERQLELILPGVWEFIERTMGYLKTTKARLLYNRVYKMYYSGTSDRGLNHDPRTRACESGEHWHKFVPEGDPLRNLHDNILRSMIVRVANWSDYL